METFQTVANIGASLASIVAIFITLSALLWKMKKPIIIKRAAIFIDTSHNSCTFHFRISNRKDYPVTIKEVHGYCERTYSVVKKREEKPVSEGSGFRDSKKLIEEEINMTVKENGQADIKVTGVLREGTNKIYLWLKTSHGNQILKCNSFEKIEDGNFEMYDESFHFNNPLKARIAYYCLMAPVTEKLTKWLVGKMESND